MSQTMQATVYTPENNIVVNIQHPFEDSQELSIQSMDELKDKTKDSTELTANYDVIANNINIRLSRPSSQKINDITHIDELTIEVTRVILEGFVVNDLEEDDEIYTTVHEAIKKVYFSENPQEEPFNVELKIDGYLSVRFKDLEGNEMSPSESRKVLEKLQSGNYVPGLHSRQIRNLDSPDFEIVATFDFEVTDNMEYEWDEE